MIGNAILTRPQSYFQHFSTRSAFSVFCAFGSIVATPVQASSLDKMSLSDCKPQQEAMQALGLWTDIEHQLFEPDTVSSGQYPEYIEAFRAGLKVSREDGDQQGVASYGLSLCAFETATLRLKMRSQAKQAANAPAVAPKTSAPAPVMINSSKPKNKGFVAPDKPPKK